MKKFNAEVSKVLHLMIHSLYTNKDIFLRELISNASDACEKKRYLALQDNNIKEGELKILVQLNEEEKTISVRDYGIGMTKQEMIDNLGTIAKSGTEEFIQEIQEGKATQSDLIGKFGVGFYSSFIISNDITVISKKIGTDAVHRWTSDGINGFDIHIDHEDFESGTEVIVKIKDSETSYLDKFKIENIIKTYSNNISFPIEYQITKDGKHEIINAKPAIWLRSKNEITSEEYKEFYKSLSHLPTEPFAIMHHKMEGNIEFTSLMFIPNEKPFDLYHPDRLTRIKLYVKHVFISEEKLDLLPQYFRFVCGIVDAQDLPLNVSRETLQDNIFMKKIKDFIIKKIFAELSIIANDEKQKDKYNLFWKNFGSILKEGLCEATSDRESLLELTRFNTTKSTEKLVSFKEYLENMKENQKEIYYIIGEYRKDMLAMPEIEVFKKNDIEVILFEDSVDSFWLSVVHDYSGKDLKNISQADIKLDDLIINDKINQEDSKEEEQKELEITKKFKEVLEGIFDVKMTDKLVESPACISIKPGSMDMRMEKYLIENHQLKKRAPKILELNPNHILIKNTFAKLNSTNVDEKNHGKELANTILELALLSHGEELANANEFTKKIVKLLSNNH